MLRYFAILLALGFTAPLTASDWPQFLGPNGSLTSSDTGVPTTWSPTENIRWKADLPGRGLSCPVIAKGRVYITACSGFQETRLHVLCYDAATGKQLWQRSLTATSNTLCHPKTCMAAPTPVTDGERVFALFATCDLAAYDRDGNLLWYRALVNDYPTVGNNVGMAASPVLAQDTLLMALENAGESFALGIDAATGRNRWKIERNRDINWTTPVVRTIGNRTEVLFQSPKDVTAYEVQTGQKRWSYEGKGFATAPTPAQGEGLILAPGGGQMTALRPSETGKTDVAWQSSKLQSSFSSPLFHKGRFYAVNSAGVVSCVDARDGKLIWQSDRIKGPFSASPVVVEDRMYLVNEQGATTVLQLGDTPKVLATNTLNETILATPAIADGAIFLRSDQHLYCIGKK